MPLDEYAMKVVTLAWTIAISGTTSGAVDTNGALPTGILMDPNGWDAASLTFLGSIDGTNYYPIYDDSGSLYTVSAGSARILLLDPTKFLGVRYLKAVATAAQTGGTRSLGLIIRYP